MADRCGREGSGLVASVATPTAVVSVAEWLATFARVGVKTPTAVVSAAEWLAAVASEG